MGGEIQFIVVGDDSVTLTNVLNYPNPFVNYTQFWFTHKNALCVGAGTFLV